LYFFLFFFAGHFLAAQTTPATPTGLTASYKKYHNRIELSWRATAPDHRYIIIRSTRVPRSVTYLDTVQQNRYIDRNNLRASTDYVYRVQALAANGAVSTPSDEAVGALLVIAEGNTTGKDSLDLDQCLSVTPTEVKVTPSVYVFRFLMEKRCPKLPDTAAFRLYLSSDAQLDDTDTLLERQNVRLSNRRGAITARRQQLPATGYLLLLITANDKTMLVVGEMSD
jgi:hypothetical protein